MFDFFTSPMFLDSLFLLYYTSFVWLPILLGIVFWDMWVDYRRALFFAKQETVLLEIKLPKEIFKSPKAMEFCLSAMSNTLGEGNWYEKYWKGGVRIHHSLEIASIEGQVHFFIWTRKGNKNQVEANLYSQFPGIEVYVVPDYTLPISYDPEKNDMFIMEFKLTKDDAYPIKTYVDYGLDKDPEEEYKVDPLTPLVEAMGALPRGSNAWLQIIIRAHTKEDKEPKPIGEVLNKAINELSFESISKNWEKKDLRWAKGGEAKIKEIMDKTKEEKRFLTKEEQGVIEALNRSINKKGFDTGMRLIYTAPKEVYSPANIGGLVGGIFHFNSDAGLNGFAPMGNNYAPKYKNFFLLWKDRSKKVLDQDKVDFLEAYKRREYFYKPHKREKYFILNTEELATIFHFPGGVLSTPTFTRIESKKGEAPSNLPV